MFACKSCSDLAAMDFIETERLVLRRWKESDIAPFAEMNADPVVMEHFPSLRSAQESKEMVENIEMHFDRHKFGLWAAELKGAKTGEFIGFIGLQNVYFQAPFTPAVEVGWRLAHKYWGRGLAPEGALAAISDLFERMNIGEIVAMTTTTNKNSMRVMEKIGMTRNIIDDFEHPRIPEGHLLRRHVLYRLDRETWLQKERSTTVF